MITKEQIERIASNCDVEVSYTEPGKGGFIVDSYYKWDYEHWTQHVLYNGKTFDVPDFHIPVICSTVYELSPNGFPILLALAHKPDDKNDYYWYDPKDEQKTPKGDLKQVQYWMYIPVGADPNYVINAWVYDLTAMSQDEWMRSGT